MKHTTEARFKALLFTYLIGAVIALIGVWSAVHSLTIFFGAVLYVTLYNHFLKNMKRKKS